MVAACTKHKTLPVGRYAGVAKSEFRTETSKTGQITVFPEISRHGFVVGMRYTLNRSGTLHSTWRISPQEGLAILESLKEFGTSERDAMRAAVQTFLGGKSAPAKKVKNEGR